MALVCLRGEEARVYAQGAQDGPFYSPPGLCVFLCGTKDFILHFFVCLFPLAHSRPVLLLLVGRDVQPQRGTGGARVSRRLDGACAVRGGSQSDKAAQSYLHRHLHRQG